MLFISTERFSPEDVARLEARGVEHVYAADEAADAHRSPSDEFAAGIYALPEEVRHAAVGIVIPCFHVTGKLLDACPNVRWIHHPGAGVNSGDFWTRWDLLDERNVVVTTAKIHAIPISEMILAFMLALAKHLPLYYDWRASRRACSESWTRKRPASRQGSTSSTGGFWRRW